MESSLREAKKVRRYGEWAGNPKGVPENTVLCVQEVWRGWLSGQCSRKRGHGYGDEYCKQHAAAGE